MESLEIFNKFYNFKLDNLPNFIKYIRLNHYYDIPLQSLPTNLQLIKCSFTYEYLDLLKKYKTNNNLNFNIYTYD